MTLEKILGEMGARVLNQIAVQCTERKQEMFGIPDELQLFFSFSALSRLVEIVEHGDRNVAQLR